MKKPLLLLIVLKLSFFSSAILEAQVSNVITDSIKSQVLKEQQHFWVKLPENYNPENNVKYPVVYLLDGFSLKNNLETVYDNYWGHYLPHMILVGISNQKNRTRNLTTSSVKTRRGAAMNDETGGAENFTKFIENELMPHIDKTYATTPYRTLIGHSYAGLFTINMLLNHSHLFSNYIAIDPSLDWDNQSVLKQAKEKLKTNDFTGKSLFVSLAAEQLHMQDETVTIDNLMEDRSEFSLFARSIVEFSQFAKSQKQSGLNFDWKVYPEDLHGTVPLPTMRDGLIFLFKWYQFKTPQKYNNLETTVEELEAMLKEQEVIYKNELGYNIPPMVEELFIAYGYMNMQMGLSKRAELFFRMNVKYYPQSANGYDSLAEYYESQKEYKRALIEITKAYEISKSDFHKQRMEAIKAKIN